jgi:hypothetical protein
LCLAKQKSWPLTLEKTRFKGLVNGGLSQEKKVKKRAKLDTKSINFFSVVIIIIIISRCNKLNFYNDEKKTLCKA